MRVVLLGPPGSGKGTMASRMCAAFAMEYLSTGAVFREEVERGTELGRRISSTVREGGLVDDETVDRVVFDRLGSLDGFLLDGYPRSIAQARSLDAFLGDDRPLTGVVLLEVPDEIVVRRLSGRLSCSACGYIGSASSGAVCPVCGAGLRRREDDEPPVVARRLEAYSRITRPLVGYYEGRILKIDGSGTVEDEWESLRRAMEPWV